MNHAPAFPDPALAPEAAQRREEILERARLAFAEKGFDGASMQDLARAACMSAGNFYRYFPSKAAIVEALIARDLAEIEGVFQAIAASPDPLAALKAALRGEMERKCEDDDDLWGEIFANAARKPEIGAILARMDDVITRRMAHALGLAAGLSEADAERAFTVHARAIFIIMHGFMSGGALLGGNDAAVTDLIQRTIYRVMDDALAESRSPR